jgi:hypothetical protein
MTHEEAARKLEVVLAHAWMVRTFLKHADEIQEDEEFMEVPRAIFDYCRAVEPAAQRGDWALYAHRARSKIGKLRKAAEFFAANFKRVTDHTNWHMAATSLTGCVLAIEAILEETPKGMAAAPPEGEAGE